jgi:hypothetical protein
MRRDLMGQNKTGRYFKYAIGEILLVVLGILIAVQINTWNQQRNRLKLEKVLLEQLRDEVLTVYEDLYRDYYFLQFGEESHYKIMDYIEDDVPYSDNMCFDFYFINQDEYIYPKVAVYSRIKEEGLDIIRNDTIRSLTQNIYESHFPRISRDNPFNPDISAFFNDYYLENFRPNRDFSLQFSSIVPSDTIGGSIKKPFGISYPVEFTVNGEIKKQTAGYVPLNFEALKKDSKFLMLLEQTRSFRAYKLRRYWMAKNWVKALVDLIDSELKGRDD